MVFLMETCLKEKKMNNIQFKCGFDNGFVVHCRGQGKERVGGITLIWKDNLNLAVNSFSTNHISGLIIDEEEEQPWFFSRVYGPKDQFIFNWSFWLHNIWSQIPSF